MKKYLQSCKTDFWKEVFEAELNYLLRELGNGKDVLSVGCGPAIIEAGLSEHGFNVTGLDVSQEALDWAPDQVRTVVGSAEGMEFAPESFDAVLYVVSIQFIEKYEKAIKEGARVLRPDGRIVMMLLNPKSAFFKRKMLEPDSYMRKIKHKSPMEIEAEAARYFSVRSEYFLGIEGTRVYPCDDSYGASLCVIKGTKKRRVENVSIGEDIVIES